MKEPYENKPYPDFTMLPGTHKIRYDKKCVLNGVSNIGLVRRMGEATTQIMQILAYKNSTFKNINSATVQEIDQQLDQNVIK